MSSLSLIPAEVWRTLHTEWLWVYRGHPVKVNEWSQEIPVPHGVFFVEEGEARIKADGVEHVIRPGQAFFTAPGVRQQWFLPGTLLLSVGFRSVWPDGTPLFRAGLNCVFRSPALHTATLQLFKTIHGRRKIVNYPDAIIACAITAQQWCQREAAFTAWFTRYHETLTKHRIFPEARASNSQRKIDEILAAIEAMPLDTPHHAPTLRLSIGRRRAEQLLKAQTGLTLKAHLDRRRLREAKQALLGGTDSLKQIAHQLSFRHASHFTLWFRKQTGITPSTFRSGGGISGA